jgi:PAS domain-containing protein
MKSRISKPKESEELFRSIFAEVPIGIAVVDLEGHLLKVNKEVCTNLEKVRIVCLSFF